MNNFQTRQYQQDCIESAISDLDNFYRSLIVLPTGAGKAYILARIAEYALQYDFRILLLIDQQNLVEQLHETFCSIGLSECCEKIYSGNKTRDYDKKIYIATRQTIISCYHEMKYINMIIADECHKWTLPEIGKKTDDCGQFHKIYSYLLEQNQDILLLGCTATPYSLQAGYIFAGNCKKNLVPYFENISYQVRYGTLINDGYLVKPIFLVNQQGDIPDFSSCRISGGEYNLHDLSTVMCRYVNAARIALEKHLSGRKHILVFCVDIKHAEKVHDAIGNESCILHSKLKNCNEVMQDFKSGKYRICISVNQLSTGFDYPAVDGMILARPTLSPALYMQQVGRGLRTAEGKSDCIVVDLVGNTINHLNDGNLDNVKVKIPRVAEKGKKIYNTKSCPGFLSNGDKCTNELHAAVSVCDRCGFAFPTSLAVEAEYPELTEVHFSSSGWAEFKKTLLVESAQATLHVAKKTKKKCMKITFYCCDVVHNTVKFKILHFMFFPEDGYSGKVINMTKNDWKSLFDEQLPKSAEVAVFLSNRMVIPNSIEVKMELADKFYRINKIHRGE